MTDDAAYKASHANIDLAMTCSICYGTYKTPKHLPCCSHSFCLPCLESLVKSDASCWNVICCPQCRTKSPLPFGGVRYFQTNIALQQIVEAWQSHPSKMVEVLVSLRKSDADTPSAPTNVSIQPDERRMNADLFLAAAIKGDVAVVCRLVRKCGRVLFSERMPDEVGSTGLHLAVRYGHVQLVKTLLKLDAWIGTPDKKENTALHYAARFGQDEIATLLVKSGYEVDVIGELSRTPFLTAASYGHSVIVRLMLTSGANIHAVDMYGATAALLASWFGSVAVLHELALFGADFTSADKFGNFPLFVASAKGHVEAVAMLLNTEAGLFIDQKGLANQTALHGAASFGCIEVAKLLILHRASIMAKDRSGLTPLELARRRGHHKFVSLIADFARGAGYPLLPESGRVGEDDRVPAYPLFNNNWSQNQAAVP